VNVDEIPGDRSLFSEASWEALQERQRSRHANIEASADGAGIDERQALLTKIRAEEPDHTVRRRIAVIGGEEHHRIEIGLWLREAHGYYFYRRHADYIEDERIMEEDGDTENLISYGLKLDQVTVANRQMCVDATHIIVLADGDDLAAAIARVQELVPHTEIIGLNMQRGIDIAALRVCSETLPESVERTHRHPEAPVRLAIICDDDVDNDEINSILHHLRSEVCGSFQTFSTTHAVCGIIPDPEHIGEAVDLFALAEGHLQQRRAIRLSPGEISEATLNSVTHVWVVGRSSESTDTLRDRLYDECSIGVPVAKFALEESLPEELLSKIDSALKQMLVRVAFVTNSPLTYAYTVGNALMNMYNYAFYPSLESFSASERFARDPENKDKLDAALAYRLLISDVSRANLAHATHIFVLTQCEEHRATVTRVAPRSSHIHLIESQEPLIIHNTVINNLPFCFPRSLPPLIA
jgi:hypothetical protein